MQSRWSHIFKYLNHLSKTVAVVLIFSGTSVSALTHFASSMPLKVIQATTWYFGFLCASLFLSQPALAAVEDNAILALEPMEGMVVVKTRAGELEVITIGDAFPDSQVVVIQVLADKVVGEEVIDGDKKITQQVWIYKAENPASGSRVERLLLSLPQNGTLVPNTQDTHSMAPDSQGGVH